MEAWEQGCLAPEHFKCPTSKDYKENYFYKFQEIKELMPEQNIAIYVHSAAPSASPVTKSVSPMHLSCDTVRQESRWTAFTVLTWQRIELSFD